MKNCLIPVLLAALPLLCSCEHKELCIEHPHPNTIRVEFDWQDAPEADPEGMCVMFYPVGGTGVQRYDFRGTKGGEVELRAGTYRVLCYNNDTEGVLFDSMEDFGSHIGYTREGNVLEPIYGNTGRRAPRAEESKDERVVITPDMMWGCNVLEVKITDDGASYTHVPLSQADARDAAPRTNAQVITLYPHELVCTYTYEVRNVKNLEHVTGISGTLSGMSPSLLFGDESLGTESVTVPFEAHSDGKSTITGKFYTFGHHKDNADPHRMAFYVITDDGKKYAYGTDGSDKYNVTDQVHSAPDKRRVHLVIDGLDLPAPIEVGGEGGGFGVGVDGWLEEIHYIHI